MKVHSELVTEALRPFHENLEKRFSELHALIPKDPKRRTRVGCGHGNITQLIGTEILTMFVLIHRRTKLSV